MLWHSQSDNGDNGDDDVLVYYTGDNGWSRNDTRSTRNKRTS